MAADLWRWAKEKTRNATYIISGRTETEKLVLEATNEEKWGPTNSQMQEISRLTYSFEDCGSIRKVISERLAQTDEVRYVQKTLILLEYILRTGHDSFRSEARSMMRTLQMLTSLHRYDRISGLSSEKSSRIVSFECVSGRKGVAIMRWRRVQHCATLSVRDFANLTIFSNVAGLRLPSFQRSLIIMLMEISLS